MRIFFNKVIGKILFKIIPNNKSVHNFCKLLINRYNNNKNFYPSKNGEFNLINSFVKSEINQKIFLMLDVMLVSLLILCKKKIMMEKYIYLTLLKV